MPQTTLGGPLYVSNDAVPNPASTEICDASGNLFQAGTALPTNAQLAAIAGVTAGTVAASKAIVVDANSHFDNAKVTNLYIGASGSETQVTATAAQLNTTTATAGTVTASKAIVVDANSHFDNAKVTNLYIGASGSETQVTATAAQLNTTTATAGTNTASKALVVDASNRIDNIILTGGVSSRFSFGSEQSAGTISMRVKNSAVASAGAYTLGTISSTNVTGGATLRIEVTATEDVGGNTTYQEFGVAIQRVINSATTNGTIGSYTAFTGAANPITLVVALGAWSGVTGATQTSAVTITPTKGTGSGATNINLTVRYWLTNNSVNGFSIT